MSHWIAKIFHYLMCPFFSTLDLSYFLSYFRRGSEMIASHALFDSEFWVILDPFIILVFVFFLGILMLLGLKLLPPASSRSEIFYWSVIKILFLSLVPSILMAVPLVGALLMSSSHFLVTFFGFKKKCFRRLACIGGLFFALLPLLSFFRTHFLFSCCLFILLMVGLDARVRGILIQKVRWLSQELGCIFWSKIRLIVWFMELPFKNKNGYRLSLCFKDSF